MKRYWYGVSGVVGRFVFTIAFLLVLQTVPLQAGNNVEQILEGIRTSYAESGFTAEFVQTSTLDVMEITDTATGRLLVKKPDKMRWEYQTPEPQTIITDGVTLWVYRPMDRQVMVGRAPVFFGEGKGAGFLSDVSRLREHFTITLAAEQTAGEYRLELEPHTSHSDMVLVFLTVNATSFRIQAVETRNQFGDTTRIVFHNLAPAEDLADSLFDFSIPEGVDIVQLDES